MNQLLKFASGAAGYVPIPWNLDFAQLEVDESSKWDISTADFITASGTVGDRPESIRFKPDGTRYYIIQYSTTSIDLVRSYDLDVPWTFIGSTSGSSISLSFYETTPTGLDFKPDGTKVYVTGTSGSSSYTPQYQRGVYEFNLSTAWDLSTSSFVQKFFESTMTTSPQGLTFKSDGTKMYLVDGTNDEIDEYDLSTAWDISTASYTSNVAVSSQDTGTSDIYFKSDGTKMFTIGSQNDKVYEYNLSTAWSANTASFNQDFSLGSEETAPLGLTFKPDGTRMYVTGSTGDDVNAYQLATKYFDLDDSLSRGIFFKPDGTKMYVSGSTDDTIREYNLSTAWEVTTASYSQQFDPTSNDPKGLFFKPDGTKMFMAGEGDVDEFDLSTAWDISTASKSYRFGTGQFDDGPWIEPRDIFFKSDGTIMYILSASSAKVYKYDLSTAWDLSTAAYDNFYSDFSVATQEDNPVGISFKTDGQMMFILGRDQNIDSNGLLVDKVHAYNLGADWDISTASYSKSFDTHSFAEQTPSGIHFKPDGTKFYVTGISGDRVYQYSISA